MKYSLSSLIKNIRMLIYLISLILVTNTIYANSIKNYTVVIESGTQAILNQLTQKSSKQQMQKKSIGEISQWVSLQLLNSPYKTYLLDKSTPEYLYISLSNTDCMLFIEEVVVVSRLIKEAKLNLSNYIAGIKQVRYHGDIAYCNRNHYFKDWAIQNENKGLINDIAWGLTHIKYPYLAASLGNSIAKNIKNIHYQNLNCIVSRESVVNSEQIGFISLKELPKYLKNIQAGDIIGVIRNPTKADPVQHLGIAYLHGGKVGMVDASSLHGKVVIEDTLLGYLAKFKNSQGIILFRINE